MVDGTKPEPGESILARHHLVGVSTAYMKELRGDWPAQVAQACAPILRREPLYTAENNYVMSLPIQYLFRTIPCGIGTPERS